MQGDFSILDRKSEENGVAEAASPFNENVGFMAYNALAGGMLTGKYVDIPAALDDPDRKRGSVSLAQPRGRMDTRGWGGTLVSYVSIRIRFLNSSSTFLAPSVMHGVSVRTSGVEISQSSTCFSFVATLDLCACV
jgi:hypothetical protein